MSKCFRKLVLKNFAKYYDLSTGFCSVKYWTHEIEKTVFRLVEAIHSELFDSYAFDFEGNYDNLIKKFRHISLFSACLNFLTLFRMGFFRAAHRWWVGGRGAFLAPPSLKSATHILQ